MEALVASERVADWLAEACGSSSDAARSRAAAALAAAACASAVYGEEACAADAAGTLLRAAERCADARCADALRAAAAACAAAAQRGAAGDVVEFPLPDGAAAPVRLRQCARLGDGLGGRVWGAAPLLVAALAALPRARLAAAAVLELGAGATGLCGLAAARLGAAHVALTDAAPPLLAQLAANVALNAPEQGGAQPWHVHVHTLDWDRDGDAHAAPPDAALPPPLPPHARFDLVLASDVLCAPACVRQCALSSVLTARSRVRRRAAQVRAVARGGRGARAGGAPGAAAGRGGAAGVPRAQRGDGGGVCVRGCCRGPARAAHAAARRRGRGALRGRLRAPGRDVAGGAGGRRRGCSADSA